MVKVVLDDGSVVQGKELKGHTAVWAEVTTIGKNGKEVTERFPYAMDAPYPYVCTFSKVPGLKITVLAADK